MKKIMVFWLCAILMMSFLGSIIPTNTSGYTNHSPIYIDGNADFTAANGVTSGNGSQSNPYIIEYWDISASSANGIDIRNTDVYFIIRNCYVHDGGESYNGIQFNNVRNGWVENTISSSNQEGICLGGSTYNNIFNNDISNNCRCIYLGQSNYNHIYDNIITVYNISYGWAGVYLDSSSYNNIYGNTIAGILEVGGITLSDSSYNNIYDNTITKGHGIWLWDASNNLIIQNSINMTVPNWLCTLFEIVRSSNNVIYHNNFVINRDQIYIDDSVNVWDNGYPSGGNYWSNYTGVDEFNGPNQDQPGSDDIGDTPYIIDDLNRDSYSLMKPWENYLLPASNIIKWFSAPSGTQPNGLAWDGKRLWMSSYMLNGGIYQLDSTDGSVLTKYTPPVAQYDGYGGLTYDGSYLWEADAYGGGIYKLNPTDCSVVSFIPSPDKGLSDLAWDGNYIWVCGYTTQKIYKISPTDGSIISVFNVPQGTGQAQTAGLTYDGVYLWLSGVNEIFMLNPLDCKVIGSFLAPCSRPDSLAWDGRYLWCASFDQGIIYQIDVGIPAPPVSDFSIAASPISLTIQQGKSDTSVITITSIGGFDQPIQLTVSGAPSGVTTTLSPEQVTPPPDGSATSTLTLSVHTTATPGSYTLTVIGTSGALTHSVDIPVEITVLQPPPENQPLVADAGLDQMVSSGDLVSLDGSNSYDPDGTIVSYRWDFGDDTTAEGKIVNHRFRGAQNEHKTYTATLTVEDNNGATDTDTVYVTVCPLEKTLEVSHQPTIPTIPIPGQPVFARMTVTYNWIHDDTYVVSKIHYESGGFLGFGDISIWDTHSHTIPIPRWAAAIPSFWNEKTYYPILERVEYGGDAFEGIRVDAFDAMNIYIFGYAGVRISAHPSIPPPFFETSSACFEPSSTEMPELPIEVPDIYLAYVGSPAELRVYDSEGRVTGLVAGEATEKIPNSVYSNHTVMIFSPNSSYHYEVAGTENGLYGLMVASFKQGESNNFTATNIPILANATHQYIIDWDALSQGEEGVTVQIDSDGNGIFEKTFTSDSELTQDEFMPQVAPGDAFPMWILGVVVAIIAMAVATIAVFRGRRKHPPQKDKRN